MPTTGRNAKGAPAHLPRARISADPPTYGQVYEATVRLPSPKRPTESQLAQLVQGVELADGVARAASVELVGESSRPPPVWLRQGPRNAKKRQRQAEKQAEKAAGADVGGAGGERASDALDSAARPHPPGPVASTAVTPRANDFVLRLAISIGRNRVVRRMCAAVGLPVYELKRVAFGPLDLERDLGLREEGAVCELSALHVAALRAAAEAGTDGSDGGGGAEERSEIAEAKAGPAADARGDASAFGPPPPVLFRLHDREGVDTS